MRRASAVSWSPPLIIARLVVACSGPFRSTGRVITSLKPEYEVVEPGMARFPNWTLGAYFYALRQTSIDLVLQFDRHPGGVTFLVIIMTPCGYAISQLRFPGPDAVCMS